MLSAKRTVNILNAPREASSLATSRRKASERFASIMPTSPICSQRALCKAIKASISWSSAVCETSNFTQPIASAFSL